jgi:hypothetical protein
MALNVVETLTEDPDFAGAKTDMIIEEETGALALASATLVDDIVDIDSVFDWDFSGGSVSSGIYNFANEIDLGGVWPSRITSSIDIEAFNLGDDIDSRQDLIDNWQDIDGSMIDDVNAELQVRTTEDDPSGSPTWTDWKRIRVGEYTSRGMQFRLICTSGSESHNLRVLGLEVVVDMEDRTEHGGPITSGTGSSYRVNYQYAFQERPAVTITANNMASQDYLTIFNDDKTGFDIVFKDTGDSIVSRTFSFIAKGYGRKVA